MPAPTGRGGAADEAAALRSRTPSPILLAYAGALLLFVLVSLYSPGFAAPAHIGTLIIVASFIGIVAIGQTMVIIGGGIDLSVPWMLNCAAMLVTALTPQQRRGAALGRAADPRLSAALVGAVNGVGIALLRVPPIVMTLATNVVLQGLLLIVDPRLPAAAVADARSSTSPTAASGRFR